MKTHIATADLSLRRWRPRLIWAIAIVITLVAARWLLAAGTSLTQFNGQLPNQWSEWQRADAVRDFVRPGPPPSPTSR